MQSQALPTPRNMSLWLWGRHFCKIKYGLDASLLSFFIQRISVESGKDSAAPGATQLRAPMSCLNTSARRHGIKPNRAGSWQQVAFCRSHEEMMAAREERALPSSTRRTPREDWLLSWLCHLIMTN